MNVPQQSINSNFDSITNTLLNQLIKERLISKDIRNKRNRKSCLDEYLPEILKRRASGWSFESIAIFYRTNHGLTQINRSTVMRRIQKFYEMN